MLSNRKPGIRLCEDGAVHIMAHTARALGLQAGDAVNIHRTRHGNVLLYVAEKQAGNVRGRVYRVSGDHYCTGWKELCQSIGTGAYPTGDMETDGEITGINIITHIRLN